MWRGQQGFMLGLICFSIVACSSAPNGSATPSPATANASSWQAGTSAGQSATTFIEKGSFAAYLQTLKQRAREKGINEATLQQAFADIQFMPQIIRSDRGQLEKKINLQTYLQRVLTNNRIQQGRANYQQYATDLQLTAKRYGVPAQYIVALWGMESAYGRIQGQQDVLSALATLAYEGRREKFFSGELLAALEIMQRYQVSAQQLKGSWAGAMGQTQFMPSSYLRYAVDVAGKGQADIWQNQQDIFASIANYLSSVGWQANLTWGQEVSFSQAINNNWAGLADTQQKTVAQWRQLGANIKYGQWQLTDNTPCWLIIADDNPQRAFLVSNNFRTLMNWNRSYFFGISVGMLADAIVQ